MLDAKMLRWHPTQPIFHWQLLGFASGKKAKKLRHLTQNIPTCWYPCVGDAEVLFFAFGDSKVPDARYIAFWWNIGYSFFYLCPPLNIYDHNNRYRKLFPFI